MTTRKQWLDARREADEAADKASELTMRLLDVQDSYEMPTSAAILLSAILLDGRMKHLAAAIEIQAGV